MRSKSFSRFLRDKSEVRLTTSLMPAIHVRREEEQNEQSKVINPSNHDSTYGDL